MQLAVDSWCSSFFCHPLNVLPLTASPSRCQLIRSSSSSGSGSRSCSRSRSSCAQTFRQLRSIAAYWSCLSCGALAQTTQPAAAANPPLPLPFYLLAICRYNLCYVKQECSSPSVHRQLRSWDNLLALANRLGNGHKPVLPLRPIACQCKRDNPSTPTWYISCPQGAVPAPYGGALGVATWPTAALAPAAAAAAVAKFM